MKEKKKVKGKGLWTALSIVFTVLFAFTMIAGPIANNYASIINMVLGIEATKTVGEPGKTYFEADFTSAQQVAEGEKVVESVELTQPEVWLRVDGDFRPGHNDAANFYYSLDGQKWEQIGTKDYRMRFDYRRFFMGSKFAIFCYATKKAGGYVDVDGFDYKKDK